MEENANSSKDGIYINQVGGDVIGVNVYGSDNIIGKNITVYQQSIYSARIPYTIIKVNNNNTTASLQQLVTYINLKLYEKDKEKLVSSVEEKDILVWDNFPDGFLQAEISVDHGLEILMAISRVKHFICTINPKRLELYKKHLWRLKEYLSFHEVTFDLYDLETVVKSYGENISRFKGAYRESVEEYLHDISEVLVKKEPTPLVVLNYYEKILNSFKPNESKTINNNAVQMANELLVPSEYYATQFVYVINQRPGDAEFLYTLKLCYDLGLEGNMARINDLQGEIFKSSAGDPAKDLSTWVYQLDKSYYMYDVARNVIKYTDHQKRKILNFLTSKKFLSSISPGSYNLLGQFVGENILFLESGSQNELLPDTLAKLIKSNANFEIGLGRGLSKILFTLQEVQLSEIFKMAEEICKPIVGIIHQYQI